MRSPVVGPILFFSKEVFRSSVRRFATRAASKLRIPRIPRTEMAFACAQACSAKPASKCKITIREFFVHFQGSLQLYLGPKDISGTRETLVYSSITGPEESSVIRGSHIGQYVESIIQNNRQFKRSF
jgi:hypothetical protein